MVRRLFYALSLVAATYPTFVACLWPAPASFTNGTSYLKLSSSFSISYAGSLASGAPSDLKSAVSTTISFLKNDNLQRLILGQGATDVPFFAKAKTLSKLTLSLNGKSKGSIPSISQNAILPLASRDESYTLKVPADGSAATITANTTVGLYRGLTTFTQLWYTFDKTIYTFQAPISIVDAPAFVSSSLSLVYRKAAHSLPMRPAFPRVHA
jgi:hexosaminidase